MTSSGRFSTHPGSSDVPWLLSRACADEWNYDPVWRDYIRHPALKGRFEERRDWISTPDYEDRSIKIAVELVRRSARQALENIEVKHFEVVTIHGVGGIGWVAVVRVA